MDCAISHHKTNSKFILKMYDKNLLQSNNGSEDCEIPIDGYFASIKIPTFGDSLVTWIFTTFAS
jgi:hypothetical protein